MPARHIFLDNQTIDLPYEQRAKQGVVPSVLILLGADLDLQASPTDDDLPEEQTPSLV
jgi:hypothetical protein